MEITSKMLVAIRPEIDAALAEVGKKFGVKLQLGRGSYTAENATFKLGIAAIAASGEVLTQEITDFKRYATSYGLAVDDLGKEIARMDGVRYKIVGLMPKRRKFPILVQPLSGNRRGKNMLLTHTEVCRLLGKKAPSFDLPDYGADLD